MQHVGNVAAPRAVAAPGRRVQPARGMASFESLSRRELQVLAKQAGLKANGKSTEIILGLRAAASQAASGREGAQAPAEPELELEVLEAAPSVSCHTVGPLADVTDAINHDQDAPSAAAATAAAGTAEPAAATVVAGTAEPALIEESAYVSESAASAEGNVAVPMSSPAPPPSSGQDFFQGLHARVSSLIASSPSMRNPTIRKSFTNLSSTLLDAVIASRDGVQLPPPRERGAFQFASPPGDATAVSLMCEEEGGVVGGGSVASAMAPDAPSPLAAPPAAAATAASFDCDAAVPGQSQLRMPIVPSSTGGRNHSEAGVERANAQRAAEAGRLQGVSVNLLSAVGQSPNRFAGHSPAKPMQSPMRKVALACAQVGPQLGMSQGLLGSSLAATICEPKPPPSVIITATALLACSWRHTRRWRRNESAR